MKYSKCFGGKKGRAMVFEQMRFSKSPMIAQFLVCATQSRTIAVEAKSKRVT